MNRLAAALAAAVVVAGFVHARSATADTSPVAYVGCSVSEMSVLGYHIDGGTRMWPSNSKYDSGFVSTWAHDTARYWPAFDRMNAQYPGAQQVWWQLCVQTGQNLAALDGSARTVLARIHAKLPDATVYVSNLPVFDPVCATTGADGIELGAAEASALVADGSVQAGPYMPLLDAAHRYINQCHPNFKGQKLEGAVLLGFFG